MKNPSKLRKTIPSQALRWAKLVENPTCSNCGVRKTVDDFPKRAVDYWCNDCRRVYARDAYRRKRDAMSKDEYRAYREEINRRHKRNRDRRISQMSAIELAAFKNEVNRGNTERRYAAKEAAYEAYGGYVCACCGETERAFLSIDHINNDGAEHKRQNNIRTGEQMYRWLGRNNYPDGFQVLCMNCQWGKRNNGGVCPHQSGKV